MALKTDAVGKTYPPVGYAVGREKIREYAAAVGEEGAVHTDPEAARAAGYADVVAPPMFAVVYASRAVAPALFDPDVGIEWPAGLELTPSQRDASAPLLKDIADDLPFVYVPPNQ